MPATTALVPLAMFLVNETTRDIYALPAEAAARIEGAKPCASIRTNITATEFSVASLDQMCASLAQGLLPKINSTVKTTWSSEHGAEIGGLIRSLQNLPSLRREAQVWPPEIPFTLSGLSRPVGMTVVFGVKVIDKQPVLLERVDLWSQVDGRFLRNYWSRSIHDPTRSAPVAKVLQRVGSNLQRLRKGSATPPVRQESIRVLVDKKISERELASLENVIKALGKGTADTNLVPIDVRKEGLVYQTQIARSKLDDVVGRLQRELPAFKAESVEEGPFDVRLVIAAPR
ncbi:hypothetical protein EBU99_12785 [bacterium]|nr:hypothetical protein [bacterium]